MNPTHERSESGTRGDQAPLAQTLNSYWALGSDPFTMAIVACVSEQAKLDDSTCRSNEMSPAWAFHDTREPGIATTKAASLKS